MKYLILITALLFASSASAALTAAEVTEVEKYRTAHEHALAATEILDAAWNVYDAEGNHTPETGSVQALRQDIWLRLMTGSCITATGTMFSNPATYGGGAPDDEIRDGTREEVVARAWLDLDTCIGQYDQWIAGHVAVIDNPASFPIASTAVADIQGIRASYADIDRTLPYLGIPIAPLSPRFQPPRETGPHGNTFDAGNAIWWMLHATSISNYKQARASRINSENWTRLFVLAQRALMETWFARGGIFDEAWVRAEGLRINTHPDRATLDIETLRSEWVLSLLTQPHNPTCHDPGALLHLCGIGQLFATMGLEFYQWFLAVPTDPFFDDGSVSVNMGTYKLLSEGLFGMVGGSSKNALWAWAAFRISEPLPAPPPVCDHADVTGDGSVGSPDFGVLIAQMGQTVEEICQ